MDFDSIKIFISDSINDEFALLLLFKGEGYAN
jgi:hypothetical protein